MNKAQKNRPKNLNLMTIRLPINALVSILHRATGCALFLSLPFILLALQWSLMTETHYQTVVNILHWLGFKLILIGLVWAFSHHFFAGLRHLAMDVHWMTTLMKARYTSKIVLALGVLITVIFAVWLLA
jgi:succinate dehydrogenase / fumarate reductase, cytochrome b subunit